MKRVHTSEPHSEPEQPCTSSSFSPRGDSLRVAIGLDYHDAAPVSGRRVGFGDAKMSVEVAVKLID